MNATFAAPLVEAAKGGAGGGGAKLTASGQAVLAAYRELEAGAQSAGSPALRSLSVAMAVPPDPETE
jgi:molybdate transport system regulatory protein